MPGVLGKQALFLQPAEDDDFQPFGQFKAKMLSTGTLIKPPKPEGLKPKPDPSDQLLKFMLLPQLVQAMGSSGGAPAGGAAPAGGLHGLLPLLLMRELLAKKTAARNDSALTLERLTGGNTDRYARSLIKQLSPDHLMMAGQGSPNELTEKLVEEIIPREILREHATRIGRGDVELGKKVLDAYLGMHPSASGENLSGVLKRTLEPHLQTMLEGHRAQALASASRQAKQTRKQQEIPSLQELIQLAENSPIVASSSKLGNAPYRTTVLQEKLAQQMRPMLGSKLPGLVRIGLPIAGLLGGAITADRGAGLAAGLLHAPAALAGLVGPGTGLMGVGAGLLGGGLSALSLWRQARRALGTQEGATADELQNKYRVPAYYDPHGKAIQFTPELLDQMQDDPRVATMSRAASSEALKLLPLATSTNLVALPQRMWHAFMGRTKPMQEAQQLLRNIARATHASNPADIGEAVRHLAQITGEPTNLVGARIQRMLMAARAPQQGSVSGLMGRPGLGDLEIKADPIENMLNMVLKAHAARALTTEK